MQAPARKPTRAAAGPSKAKAKPKIAKPSYAFGFLDETGALASSRDPFFAVGMLRCREPYAILRPIQRIRDRQGFYDEIKWNKISAKNLPILRDLINVFVSCPSATFSAFIVDKQRTTCQLACIVHADAAGIYRWVVFGDVNTLHGGSTVHTLTGESEVFPASAEVEAGARSFASRERKVTRLACRQTASYYTWDCSLRFAGGQTALYRGIWNESQHTLGWSVTQRKAPVRQRKATVHFKVPIGPRAAKRQTETYETGYIERAPAPPEGRSSRGWDAAFRRLGAVSCARLRR